MVTRQTISCDIAIAGGGLAGCLIALALAEKRPELDVVIIETGETLGGNHVWSFFDSDVAAEHRWLIEPLICHSWQGYDIAFPAHIRTLDAVYNSIESERLDAVVRATLKPDQIVTGKVVTIDPRRPQAQAAERHLWAYDLVLEDGRKIEARQVIDARGPGDLSTLKLGWQKFVGLLVTVPGGHGLSRPIVKDATVEQIDGYRFVYCLPFDAETVFIEDTYYSDTPDLDVAAVRERIIAYAAAKGWHTNGGGREETGVLPVVIGGDFDAYWASTGHDVAKAGLRAGQFHATTGYSLPSAVRYAAAMPDLVDKQGIFFATASRRTAKQLWRKGRFYRMLDAMLFKAAEPHLRYKVLERFYRLSPGLIARFYAGQTQLRDKARILMGKPPVPIHRAIKAIWEQNK
jgi:lycopene beta-cyclase